MLLLLLPFKNLIPLQNSRKYRFRFENRSTNDRLILIIEKMERGVLEKTYAAPPETAGNGSRWTSRGGKEGRLGEGEEDGKKGRGWMQKKGGWRVSRYFSYRSSNEAATDLFPVVGFCLLAAYTVFCDEDFGRGPSSFQMDVLHHEFSESMFCWYIHNISLSRGDGQPRVQP